MRVDFVGGTASVAMCLFLSAIVTHSASRWTLRARKALPNHNRERERHGVSISLVPNPSCLRHCLDGPKNIGGALGSNVCLAGVFGATDQIVKRPNIAYRVGEAKIHFPVQSVKFGVVGEAVDSSPIDPAAAAISNRK